MSPKALRATLGARSQALVARTIVARLHREISAGREPPVKGNLRTLGYRYVMPVFWRLWPDGPRLAWYTRLIREMRRMVVEWRCFSYRDFDLTDELWEGRRIGDRRPDIVVFAEDYAMVRLNRRIHALHGVTTVTYSGTPSALTTEYTAAHVGEALARLGSRTRLLHLVALTDYDPHGRINGHALQRQLAAYDFPTTHLTWVVGPHLLDPDTLLRVRIPLRRRGAMRAVLNDWMEETGGIDGQPFKLEVSSIPPARLLTAVTDAIDRLPPLD